MAHVVYVDLSAKLEQWSRASAVAVSNDTWRVYLVTGAVKRRVRQLIRKVHGGKSDQYRLLAALVYLVVREDLAQIGQIVIDRDYAGAQVKATIKNLLLDLLRRDRPDAKAGMIRFQNIKGSKADRLAKQVYDGEMEPGRWVQWRELEALLRG